MRKSKFYIFNFTFYILLILTINNCSSTTEVSKGDLTGIVNLEGMEDNSGIIIAIYELAELDETIVGINSEYPHIGVIITQHTEFDHRFQSPVKYTETDAEGYFEIKKIPTGTYNIVAIKDSFGFKYIYEFEIEKNDNELTQQITLYEELHFSNYIDENTIFETDHHYIIDDDTDVLSNYSLTIQPCAIIRIEPGKDFTILGTLTAQGEENNMFWVTSNDGFSQNQIPNTINPDEVAIYNSMILSEWATVSDDLISWGKFDFANTCLMNQVNNLHMQNGIFRNGNCGYYSTSSSTEDDSTFCSNILCENIIDEGKGGLFIEYIEKGNISKNILINNNCGALVKDRFTEYIENNYFTENSVGLSLWHFLGNVSHNELNNNSIDIKFTGNMNSGEIYGINIEYNNLYSEIAINHFQFLTYAYQYYSGININNNNFENNQWFLQYHSYIMNEDIDATSNYFDGLNSSIEIYNRIIDSWETGTIQVLIEPWLTNKVNNAGIQQ